MEAEGKKAATLSLHRHNLNKTILPKLGNRPARAVTAKNARAGERVPNRVLADQPVPTAQMLLRRAGDALAAHFDVVFVEGTTSAAAVDVTSGLLDITTNAGLHVDAPASTTATITKISAESRERECAWSS